MLRYALLQAGCAAAAAVSFLAFAGSAPARAALAGGMIAAVGTLLSGWRTFAPGVAPPQRLARALYAGEALKWLWIVGALWLALTVGHLAALPLVLGLVAAKAGFWLGVAWIR